MANRRYHLTVKDLIDASKKNPEVLTLEATVITGFEGIAMEECREKCLPLDVSRAQGRIYFNIFSKNFDKVLKLRAVDNLFLVNDALGTPEFSKDKQADLELIKTWVDKISWVPTLTTWATLVNFEGVIFKSKPQIDKVVLEGSENTNNENAHKIICPNEFDNKKSIGDTEIEAMSQLTIQDNEKLFSRLKRRQNVSESSEEMYFSAEEDCAGTEQDDTENITDETLGVPSPDTEGLLKFRVTCNRAGEHSFQSPEAACAFGGALNDKFNWTVDLTNYNLNVILNINKDAAYVCSAITDKSLHRRNISHFGYVTLRSTMCYCLVRLAEPVKGEIILDPLCGGGSIPIEGSLGFPYTFHIGGDNDDKAMTRSCANLEHLKRSEENRSSLLVDPLKWNARRLPLRSATIDVCVTDLPFGKRSGRKSDNLPLYRDVLSEMARVTRCGTSRAVCLTHDKVSFTKALKSSNEIYWRQIRTVAVNQGGLFSTAFLLLRTAKPFVLGV